MLKKLSVFARESVVRIISRGGDFAIANTVMFACGETYFLYATLAGAIWNGFSDLIGQRSFVYPESHRSSQRLLRQSIPYVLMRLSVAVFGFALLSFLFYVLSWPYAAASLTTTLMFWFVSYKMTKMFFTGPSNDMPKKFRPF